MNRRGALVTIGLTAIGGVAWTITKPRLGWAKLPHASLDGSSTPSNQALDDLLREDIARLDPRVDSEEGIPVFLVCENLVPESSSHPPAQVALTPMNAALTSAFHRNAEAWLRIRPDAQSKDVAKLIEVLAYRDFTQGRTAEQP